jgi:hypothetical protein
MGSGAHSASYTIGTGGYFPGGKELKLSTHLYILLELNTNIKNV